MSKKENENFKEGGIELITIKVQEGSLIIPPNDITAAQTTAKRIREMKPHPDYELVDDIPIPVGLGIVVKPWKPAGGIIQFDSGLLGSVQNTKNQGIIMAVGPKCSDWVRPGLMCKFYDPRPECVFLHTDGQEYFDLDEGMIKHIIPNPNTISYGQPKDSDDRRREKRKDQLNAINKQEYKDDQNEKDRRNDKTAGKTQILYGSKGEA